MTSTPIISTPRTSKPRTSAPSTSTQPARAKIPFNQAHIAGKELYYIAQAVSNGELKGDGPFTQKCSKWFEETMNVPRVLLTHSCTGALEMSALLLNIQEGDEVIMPSFTFTSTANAFLLRGAHPKFVDISPTTLNIDPAAIEAAIGPKTKAICVVHYAGVGCEMDEILALGDKHGIPVIEDAAHAVMAKYKGQFLGTLGALGTFSFHETKNYSSGEGGALLLNSDTLMKRAEIIREKGTNRSEFFRGEVNKYGWQDVGSSFLPSEIISAFLYGQLEHADAINNRRLDIWNTYFNALRPLEAQGALRLPIIPDHSEHNAHMFYVLLPDESQREALRQYLNSRGCTAVIHYVPLHSAPMGLKLGYQGDECPVTSDISGRLLRLPLYCDLTADEISYVIENVRNFFSETMAIAV